MSINQYQINKTKILEIINKIRISKKNEFEKESAKYKTPKELSSIDLVDIRRRNQGFIFTLDSLEIDIQQNYPEIWSIIFFEEFLDKKCYEWEKTYSSNFDDSKCLGSGVLKIDTYIYKGGLEEIDSLN